MLKLVSSSTTGCALLLKVAVCLLVVLVRPAAGDVQNWHRQLLVKAHYAVRRPYADGAFSPALLPRS